MTQHTICFPDVFFSIDYHSDKINGCHIDCRENVDALVLCVFISCYFALFSFCTQSIIWLLHSWSPSAGETSHCTGLLCIAYWGPFVACDAFTVNYYCSIKAFFRSLRFNAQKHFLQTLLSATHHLGFIELQPIIPPLTFCSQISFWLFGKAKHIVHLF